MNLTPTAPVLEAAMEAQRHHPIVPSNPQSSAGNCAMCYGRPLCAAAVAADALQGGRLVSRRIRVARNNALFRQGDLVGNRYYVVHYGSFKTCRANQGDGQRITGFQLNADSLALDAIGMRQHQYNAIALEDSEVCEILYSSMQPILPVFHRMLSREIAREQQRSFLLRDASADQRLATFLLDWSERLRERGLSSTSFLLRMTRQDIADYLSLTRESVSRGIVRFQRKGLLAIDGRELVVRDVELLRQLAGTPAAPPQLAQAS
jgi:CRP/FNR family transcriptional regulator